MSCSVESAERKSVQGGAVPVSLFDLFFPPSLLPSIAKVKLARKCTVEWKITYLFLLFL